MRIDRILDILGSNLKFMTDPPNREHHVGNVNSEGTIHGTSAADITLHMTDMNGPAEKIYGHIPFFFEHLPAGLFNLGRRRIARIPIVGKKIGTGVGAKSATHAGIHIGFKPGPCLIFQHLIDGFNDPFPGQSRKSLLNGRVCIFFFIFSIHTFGIHTCNLLKLKTSDLLKPMVYQSQWFTNPLHAEHYRTRNPYRPGSKAL